MKIAVLIARIFVGGMFIIGGLNGVLTLYGQEPFMKPEPTPEAGAFMGALVETGYLFHLVKWIELIAGVMIIANVFLPFALTMLAPIMVNIVLLHLVHWTAPDASIPAYLLAAGMAFLTYAYRNNFRSMLEMRPYITP